MTKHTEGSKDSVAASNLSQLKAMHRKEIQHSRGGGGNKVLTLDLKLSTRLARMGGKDGVALFSASTNKELSSLPLFQLLCYGLRRGQE